MPIMRACVCVTCLFLGVVNTVYAEEKLSLSDILTRVVQNPAIIAKSEMTKATQAQVNSANYQYYPTPILSVQRAQTSAKDVSYQGDNLVTNLGLQQPIWTGGKLDAGLQKAEYEHKASLSELEESTKEIQLRAVQSYSDWLIASAKIQVAERSIAAHQQLYHRIERRVNEGLSAESDLTLALSRLQQAQADSYSAKIQQQAALARLSQLLGQEVSEQSLMIEKAKAIPNTANQAVALAMSTHPSIQKLTFMAQAALAEIEVQSSAYYPDVVAKVEQQYGNFQYQNTDSDVRFFVTLQSKLGAGLSTQSAVESARLKHQAALSDIEASKRTITEQTLTEWTNAKQLVARLAVLKSALVSAEKIADAWDRQFVSGKKSWLDVMNAVRELSQTENQLAETSGGLITSSWKLALLTSSFSLTFHLQE